MQHAQFPQSEPRKKILNGLEYEAPPGENCVIIFCLDKQGKQIKISFRPLENKFLEQYKDRFKNLGVGNLTELYDKNVLTDLVRRYGPGVIPLDSEPPLDYESPEDPNNGKVEIKGLDEQAKIFNVTPETLLKAYKTAQLVYCRERLKLPLIGVDN